MKIYIDIDGTICNTNGSDYRNSQPILINIEKINKLFDLGNTIIYWSARGMRSGTNHEDLTKKQLENWNCKYHKLIMNNKPDYDLLICDKTKRIEEV